MQREDILATYKVAELVTVARDGSPVCWPMAPALEGGRLAFSTGYMYPTKARNARRDPRVAALFSDPTASGRDDDDPLVLVQGRAEVFDEDIQRNTERYVDQLLTKGPPALRLGLRFPLLRAVMAGYLARIWIEVVPEQDHVWPRGSAPPAGISEASRPSRFEPSGPTTVPSHVLRWLARYRRPPVLSYIAPDGRPAMTRVHAEVRPDRIRISPELVTHDGAPACLTYHRLVGNYRANDAFLIRGHFDAAGGLVPERIVGYGGTVEDRGLGSLNLLRLIRRFGEQLPAELARQGHPAIVARPSARTNVDPRVERAAPSKRR